MRSLGMSFWAGVALLWTSVAAADPRVVVFDFKGPNAKQARAAVVSVLGEHHVELVPSKKAAATARTSGAELDSESGRVRVAKKLKLRGFIEGHITTLKKKLQISVQVFGGGDGMTAGEYSATLTKSTLVKDIKAHFWSAVGAYLGESSAEPSPEVEPEPIAAAPTNVGRGRRPAPLAQSQQPPAQALDRESPPGVVASAGPDEQLAEHADQEEPTSDRPSPFDLGISARLGTRSFDYTDSLPGLRPYSLPVNPNAVLHLHWYPAAHFQSGALANLGLDLRGEMLFSVPSKNELGQRFDTTSHAFGIGLRARIPLGKVELGGIAGFGQHTFSLADSRKVDPNVPDVAYNFIRTGVEADWKFMNPLTLEFRTAFLWGLSLGEIASAAWFPHTTGNGVEAELGLAYAASQMFAFELAFSMERYFMTLNPEVTDPGVRGASMRVAGGALDKYFSSRIGMILRL
jgi:hypothetical protein